MNLYKVVLKPLTLFFLLSKSVMVKWTKNQNFFSRCKGGLCPARKLQKGDRKVLPRVQLSEHCGLPAPQASWPRSWSNVSPRGHQQNHDTEQGHSSQPESLQRLHSGHQCVLCRALLGPWSKNNGPTN